MIRSCLHDSSYLETQHHRSTATTELISGTCQCLLWTDACCLLLLIKSYWKKCERWFDVNIVVCFSNSGNESAIFIHRLLYILKSMYYLCTAEYGSADRNAPKRVCAGDITVFVDGRLSWNPYANWPRCIEKPSPLLYWTVSVMTSTFSCTVLNPEKQHFYLTTQIEAFMPVESR